MAVSEAVVNRLKTELKRTLRKHVGEAVNDVCDAFADELRPVEPPLTPTPHVGALGKKEVDYNCCWRLVEYMERNMDTSPSFAQQMDCIILAYQSNASSEILNSVVTQSLWVRRKGGESESLEKKTVELPVKTSEEDTKQLSVKYGGSLGSTGSEKIIGKVNGDIAANMAKEKCTSGSDITKQSDPKSAGDAIALNKVVAEVKTVKRKDTAARTEVSRSGDKLDQVERNRANGFQVRVSEVDISSGVQAQTRAAPVLSNDAAIMDFTSSVVRAKSSKTRSLPVQQYTELSRESSSEKDMMSSSSTQTSSTESSRPREWGKRKLLVTRKRSEAGKARVKRARQVPQQHVQPPDQSSTETDNSDDDDKANGFQKKKDDLDAAKAVMKDMKSVGQQMPVKEILVKRKAFQYPKLPVATIEDNSVEIGPQGTENVKKRFYPGIVKMKSMATGQVVTQNMASAQITTITKPADPQYCGERRQTLDGQ